MVVREGWDWASAPDCFEKLFCGIEACQLGLCQWCKDIHNNPREQIEKIKKQLHELSLGPQIDQSKSEGAKLRAELEKLYLDEDVFWRQRSKVTWAQKAIGTLHSFTRLPQAGK